MENGWKDAIVTAVEPVFTSNPDGKMPMGTPGINVTFTVDGGKYNDRKVWNRYWFPPADYDAEAREKTINIFSRFLKALGITDEQIKTPDFNLTKTIEDMIGAEVQVSTKYDEDYDNNKVNNVRARQEGSATTSGPGVL